MSSARGGASVGQLLAGRSLQGMTLEITHIMMSAVIDRFQGIKVPRLLS